MVILAERLFARNDGNHGGNFNRGSGLNGNNFSQNHGANAYAGNRGNSAG